MPARKSEEIQLVMPVARPRSLVDLVYQAVLESILTRKTEAGQPLAEEELARQLGVSKTPVREAISRLANEGFIEKRRHQPPVVRQYTCGDIEDLYLLRESLESMVTVVACRRAQLADWDRLQTLWAECGHQLQQSAYAEYSGRALQFHDLLVEISGSPILQAAVRPVRLQWTIVRRKQSSLATQAQDSMEHLHATHQEHGRILTAILQRDEKAAAEAMRVHVQHARDAFFRLEDRETKAKEG